MNHVSKDEPGSDCLPEKKKKKEKRENFRVGRHHDLLVGLPGNMPAKKKLAH